MSRQAIDLRTVEYPHGSVPDKQVLTVGDDDLTPYGGRGCIVQVLDKGGEAAPVLNYVTVMGRELSEPVAANGFVPRVGIREVEVVTILGSSTVTKIAVAPL